MNTPLITLDQWAAKMFNPPPGMPTIRRYAREGRIWPPPQKVGRAYYVAANAQYIDPTEPTSELVERLKHGT